MGRCAREYSTRCASAKESSHLRARDRSPRGTPNTIASPKPSETTSIDRSCDASLGWIVEMAIDVRLHADVTVPEADEALAEPVRRAIYEVMKLRRDVRHFRAGEAIEDGV